MVLVSYDGLAFTDGSLESFNGDRRAGGWFYRYRSRVGEVLLKTMDVAGNTQ